MNFLTPEQRTHAIAALSTAPDEVLLTMMVELRKIAHFEQGMRTNVTELFNEPSIYESAHPPVATATRKNVSPGLPTTTKIGTVAKEYIMEALGMIDPVQPGPRYAEHLKLLWSRGEVKFDGLEFYL